ncbi:MAG: hypothetical protein IJI83_03160 [Oscillospiraceae bacterium]|nr:hypothetical protein [Oscillospiraceae bacterium]
MTNIETLVSERRQQLEKQAVSLGYDLDYEPDVLMEDIRLLPDSYWHDNRAKGWGGSNEGVLNGISHYSTLTEVVNEKLLNRKAPVDDDKQFIFDFGHALEWVMLKRYAAVNGYKFLTYKDYFVLVKTKEDLTKTEPCFKKAQEGLYSFVTRDKEQAEALLAKIKSKYPASFIVEQESNDPKDVREITDEEHELYDAQGIVCVDRRQYINSKYPSMLGDMDGLCLPPDGSRIGIECKTYTHKAPKGCFASGVLGDSGAIKNEEYHFQVQHYMAVCNIDRFDIVACCGNLPEDFTITTVYRDIEFEKAICENCQETWEKYVENLQPVEEINALSEESAKSLIVSLTPDKVNDDYMEVPASFLSEVEILEKINDKLKTKKDEVKALEEKKRKHELTFEGVLSGNSHGYMITEEPYDYEFEFKQANSRAGFDDKTLKANYPDIWEKYKKASIPGGGNRTFKFFRTKKREVL